MLRLCTVALALMACGVVAAPAPVFRPSKAPKSPYEAMLAGLRKTGKATGPRSKDGGTWTLTAEKVEGHIFEKVVLTMLGSDGQVKATFNALSGGCLRGKENKGVLELFLCGVVITGDMVEGEAGYKVVALALTPGPLTPLAGSRRPSCAPR